MKLSMFLKLLNISIDSVFFPTDTEKVIYLEQEIIGLTSHSRSIQKGFVFSAVKGFKSDGLDFVSDAVLNGAVAVLTDRIVQTSVPVILVDNVRHYMARAANILYPSEKLKKIAVTGTNGKTSTVYFVNQILNKNNRLSASIGTIGIDSPVYQKGGSMTTPDSVFLHETFNLLADKSVEFVALEASSHGLDQHRLDGTKFVATGFTNLTRDHLDYHQTMENYMSAKMKLFLDRTDLNGTVILNADIPEFQKMYEQIKLSGRKIYSYGYNGKELNLVSQKPTITGQEICVEILNQTYTVSIPVFGDFQVMNLLCAIGLCLGTGLSVSDIVGILPELKAPTGRLEPIVVVNGAQIFVDYAHTPDALERVLISLRPHTTGRLICLFGCGGNRDTGKRSQMGRIADKLADVVYITDDNPRFENPIDIRQMIKEECPKGIEIGSRIQAIATAIQNLSVGDILVLCGKGHETGQTVQDIVYQFNDKTEVLSQTASFFKPVLWQGSELSMALNTEVSTHIQATGVSIDTRTLEAGDLFIALKGEKMDGHQFAITAIHKGASACLVDRLISDIPPEKQIIVSDTLVALEALARFARMRSEAVFIGITGSSGKTTTKEMLKAALSEQGKTYATAGNFNNEIGVPLMLSRMPLDTEYAVIEMGMNHFGEMSFLSDLVRPHHTMITMVGAAHRAYFKNDLEIASAKAEIYDYADKKGVAVLNKESPFFDYLSEQAHLNNIRKVVSFGQKAGANFEMTSCRVNAGKTTIKMKWNGEEYHYSIGFTGRHFALNSLGVLALVDAVGASVELAMQTLERQKPVAGRGASEQLYLSNGVQITLIDDAYNANPASMKASIQTLGAYRKGRRIAVLGDMLELGEESVLFHQKLGSVLIENEIDCVFCVGPLMKNLYDILPSEMKGGYSMTVESIISDIVSQLQTDDTVLIKASNGMNLKKIIIALKGDK
ncbi:MAG: UDP-N-acetylmuramoyl-L-alanyl-D-glutamate--2,6-diaminopimelate ligase [Alphaproteobacteria bacterium]|nr:UDP-N-acetylmuramoyl-L-alanyl-D-glutamate--2,6-diaminopimelate ligase [Alphaproteobacteria bacterium]